MISRGSQSIGRFSQLRISCLLIRRNELWLSRLEGKATSSSVLSVRSRARNRCISPISCRTYADRPVSRPKAHTGRTTTTRKEKTATATKAAKTPSSEAPSKRVVKKSKAKPLSESKSKASTAKRSKAKAKPKSKPRVKKVLTEEDKVLLAAKAEEKKIGLVAKKEKEKIKELKAKALKPPKHGPISAWLIFSIEQSKGATSSSLDVNGERQKDSGSPIPNLTKINAQAYRELSPERLEHYNHIANQTKILQDAKYREWVLSHSADKIRDANSARSSLRRRGMKTYQRIADDRQVRGNVPAHLIFLRDRFASGDYRGISNPKAVVLIHKEWKELSSEAKQKYMDLAYQDRQRKFQEWKSAYNRDPPGSQPKPKETKPASDA